VGLSVLASLYDLPTMPDFFDHPDEIDVVLIDEAAIARAQRFVVGCKACNPVESEFPFDWLLDHVTGRLGSKTDYVLESPAKCPNCRHDILEKTLVDAEWSEAAENQR